jgi:hypothetical protein
MFRFQYTTDTTPFHQLHSFRSKLKGHSGGDEAVRIKPLGDLLVVYNHNLTTRDPHTDRRQVHLASKPIGGKGAVYIQILTGR